jgi:hypothetical protein
LDIAIGGNNFPFGNWRKEIRESDCTRKIGRKMVLGEIGYD